MIPRLGFLIVIVAVVSLFALSACTPGVKKALGVAGDVSRVEDCDAFQAARVRVMAVKEDLSTHDLKKAILLNEIARVYCASALSEATAELNAIADGAS